MKSRIKISRDELYRLVWERPRVLLCTEFGVSDVAISKACRRQLIPTPPPGYWQKYERVGYPSPAPLPSKPFGRSIWTTLNQTFDNEGDEIYPFDPLAPPSFGSQIQELLARAGSIATYSFRNLPKDIGIHPSVQKVLEADAVRSQSELFLAHVPRRAIHTTDLAKRRLALVSALCHLLSAIGASKLSLPHHAKHLLVRIGEVDIPLFLDLCTDSLDGEEGKDISFRFSSPEMLTELALPLIIRGYEEDLPTVVSQVLVLAEVICRLRDVRRYETRVRKDDEQKLLERQKWVERLRGAAARSSEAKALRQLATEVSGTKECLTEENKVRVMEWIRAANAYADSIDPLRDLATLIASTYPLGS